MEKNQITSTISNDKRGFTLYDINGVPLRIFSQHRRKPRNVEKQVEGFDTETQHGYARILSDSHKYIEVHDIHDVLENLTRHVHRDKLNVFYNLGFDVECLLKWEPLILRELADGGRAEYGDYKFYYIPKKMFRITDVHRHTYSFYDIAQFYGGSLASNVLRLFGKNISEKKEDRAHLFETYTIPEIGEYCTTDAAYTRMLGERFLEDLRGIDLRPSKLISCGNLSSIYTLQNSDLPTIFNIPHIISNYYWRAYRGGWFDTYKKGVFRATSYDIASAYPWALMNIPDPRYGKWYNSIHPDASMGVVKCEITRPLLEFNPVGIKRQQTRFYPYYDVPCPTYLTLGEYRQFEKTMGLKVLNAYSFVSEPSHPNPYGELVRKLYALRQARRNDHRAQAVIKIILNSLYGKTCEKHPQGTTLVGGNLFNPLFAAETTARTRLLIYSTFAEYAKNIIAVLTDSVIMDKYIEVPQGKELGQMKLEHQDHELLLVGCGVYQYRNESAHSRGFSKKYNLFEICNTEKDTIPVPITRPTHYREAIKQGRESDIGVFKEMEYTLNLNSDVKRLWLNRIHSGKELLEKTFESRAIPYSLLHPYPGE